MSAGTEVCAGPLLGARARKERAVDRGGIDGCDDSADATLTREDGRGDEDTRRRVDRTELSVGEEMLAGAGLGVRPRGGECEPAAAVDAVGEVGERLYGSFGAVDDRPGGVVDQVEVLPPVACRQVPQPGPVASVRLAVLFGDVVGRDCGILGEVQGLQDNGRVRGLE